MNFPEKCVKLAGRMTVAVIMLCSSAMGATPVSRFFNGVFPPQSPGTAMDWNTPNAFPGLTFSEPIWLTEIPGSSDLLLVEKTGIIWRFPNNAEATTTSRTQVLDLREKLQISEDQGLYRLIFHPEFGQPGSQHMNDVFLCYSHRPDSTAAAPDRSMWRVSKFQWVPGTGTVDPSSESVLIQQYDPHRWHNAGAMCFDNQGFLMITCGDGGGANNEFWLTQTIKDGFFGGVLRIDVDNDPGKSHAIRRQPLDPRGKPASFPPSFTQGYGIPNDNPWVGNGVLEEFYALGLRSPHTAHYDSVSGDLWVGDVGQASFEELNRITKGNNAQWSSREGPTTGWAWTTDIGTSLPPFYSYGRSVGECIIGGPRYRGAKWDEDLGGKVIIADNIRGTVSNVDVPLPGRSPTARQMVGSVNGSLYTGISNICTDSSGEIYLLKFNGRLSPTGNILKLTKASVHPQPPPLLSATGLFTNILTLEPSPALQPYEVANPLWSDGAEKKRWMAVPNDGTHNTQAEKISFSPDGNWIFPEGTVLVKHFEIPVDSTRTKRLETRVMVCMPGGAKYGVSYKWNAAGTDAELLLQGVDEVYEVTPPNGIREKRMWNYPSRSDCMTCHTEVTGHALGLRTHQLNRMVTTSTNGQMRNQLSIFSSKGLFEIGFSPYQIAETLRSHSIDDTTAPVEHRVRSYLDSNCSHCHQPGATVPYFDARLTTPLKSQNLINALIQGQFHMDPEGRYIKPSDAGLSAIPLRTASITPGVSMPPLGKNRVDQEAVDLIENYIKGLNPAHFTGEMANYARCEIAGPSETVSGEFEVIITFDQDYSGISENDVMVDGSKITGLVGKGYYYVATIRAYSSTVSVWLPQKEERVGYPGILQSNTISVQNNGPRGPVATFTSVPEQLPETGVFEFEVSFDQTIIGLGTHYFSAENGSVVELIRAGDNTYRVVVGIHGTGDITLALRRNLVEGTNGLFMGTGVSVTIPIATPILSVEAEEGEKANGFVVVEDAGASGGSYLWVPEGLRGGLPHLDPSLKTSYQVNVPNSGDYQINGWVRSDNTGSDSFYLGIDGGSPVHWSTNETPGEKGSGRFHPDFAGDKGKPHTFVLKAGTHSIDLYAADDGTRIDRLELIPLMPIPRWIGDGRRSDSPLEITLEFTNDVTGLEISDFHISDETVVKIVGTGRRYRIIVESSGNYIYLSLKKDAVLDSAGRTNPASPPILLHYVNTYQQWATDHGADDSESSDNLDKDGDGIGQLLEYALGLDPNVSDRKILNLFDQYPFGLPQVNQSHEENATYLSMTFLRRIGGLPLVYSVEFTSDFVTYNSQSSFLYMNEPISETWEKITAYDYTATGLEKARFVRLRVAREPDPNESVSDQE